MRLLLLLPLLLVGCAQTSLESAVYTSSGCQNLNDTFYDDAYRSGNVYFSPFLEGERVTVSLTNPDAATTIYLIVTDTSGEAREDLGMWNAESAEPLSYTFTQNFEQAEVYWSADAGVPAWEVVCQ